MAENSPDVPVAYQAISRAGAVITPAIFLLTADELRRVLVDSGASVVLASPHFRDVVDAAAEGVDTVRHVLSLEDAASADADPLPIVPREVRDVMTFHIVGTVDEVLERALELLAREDRSGVELAALHHRRRQWDRARHRPPVRVGRL